MPNQPIGLRELLNHIFCATFGQPLSVASEQELEPIRDSIAKLRRCYKANTPESAYGNSSARQAYMLAYYPYYIQPAMKIFSEIILKEPKIAAANELNLSFMAGGPCSEAIGVTEALQRNGKKCPVNITILDRELGWKDQHDLTQRLCQHYQPEANITGFIGCNILQSCQTCPNAEQCRSKVFDTTNVYFLQNYSAISPTGISACSWNASRKKSGWPNPAPSLPSSTSTTCSQEPSCKNLNCSRLSYPSACWVPTSIRE